MRLPPREELPVWVLRGLVLLVAAAGVVKLCRALSLEIAAAVSLVALVALSARATEFVGKLLGAAIVATVTLLGFNALTDNAGDWPIIVGLLVGFVLHALVAAVYLLEEEGFFRTHVRAAGGGASIAFCFIVLVPVGLDARQDEKKVPSQQQPALPLDVLIVAAGERDPLVEIEDDPRLNDYDVRYSVGFARGREIEWTLIAGENEVEAGRHLAGGGTPLPGRVPRPRTDADTVLVLSVDATPPAVDDPAALPDQPQKPGEVRRWRRLARAAAPPSTPTYALLQTQDERRLQKWKKGFGGSGNVLTVREFGGPTLAETAVALAIRSDTADEEMALAIKHQPMLFFARRETAPRPLAIDWLFDKGLVSVCSARGTGTGCDEPTPDPRRLVNGGTHLRLDLPKPAELKAMAFADLRAIGRPVEGGGPLTPATPRPPGIPYDLRANRTGEGTAMYVHPVAIETARQRLLYLDYWWYLPYNDPASESGDGFCGAGLFIPGKTCFDHVSDWEGLTVVIDRTTEVPVVEAVHYAQHEHVVRYEIDELREHWRGDPQYAPFLDSSPDADARPLAFSARGTHATYPNRCTRNCRQVDAGPEEKAHDGGVEWVGNTHACGSAACLLPLPTRRGGTRPALWNAFEGAWGEQRCVLRYYCDSGSPPKAPGQQDRYKDPTDFDGTDHLDGRLYDPR